VGLVLKREIRVEQQLWTPQTGEPYVIRPKRGSVGTMPVGDAVIKGLAMYLEEFPASEPIEGVSGHEELLLFTNRFGRRMRRQSWNDVWNKAAKKADLPPGTTPHDLRHYYASLLIAKGCSVKAVQTALRHKTATETLEPGSLLGELSVIDGKPRSATLTALSPVEVLAVAVAPFNDFLDRHPQVLRRLLVEVIDRLRKRVRHQLEFGVGDALGRVCARLAELAERHGEIEGEVVRVRSPVSQADLAAWTGLSREAVVKALRTLRQLGWIDTRGRTIAVQDLERVRQRATH
jgi:CRP-like cAMP-binding protein